MSGMNAAHLPLRTCEQTSHGVIFLYVYSCRLCSESVRMVGLMLALPFFLYIERERERERKEDKRLKDIVLAFEKFLYNGCAT